MIEQKWKYVKKLDDSNKIRDFLKRYNVKLPESIIMCMEKNNGGRPSEPEFSTDQSEGYVFKSLFSYNKKDLENIYLYYPEMFKDTSLFPIGMDSSGNFVCYDTEKQIMVLWMHETSRVEVINIR